VSFGGVSDCSNRSVSEFSSNELSPGKLHPFTVSSVLEPMWVCERSQNGLFFDAPQRKVVWRSRLTDLQEFL
jgi:hypothetical protein